MARSSDLKSRRLTVADDESVEASPWYKRRAWLVSVVLVAVVAATVAVDLPKHGSRTGQISDDSRVVAQVNQDVGPCSYALSESFTIYGDLSRRTLTASGPTRSLDCCATTRRRARLQTTASINSPSSMCQVQPPGGTSASSWARSECGRPPMPCLPSSKSRPSTPTRIMGRRMRSSSTTRSYSLMTGNRPGTISMRLTRCFRPIFRHCTWPQSRRPSRGRSQLGCRRGPRRSEVP